MKSKTVGIYLTILATLFVVLISAVATVFLSESRATAEQTQTVTETQAAASNYIYESNFSTSTEKVTEFPEYWEKSTSYLTAEVYQQNGALFIDSMTAAGLTAVYFTGMTGCDYSVEADLTMVERVNNARWVGGAYRSGNKGNKFLEMFAIKASDVITLFGYYSTDTQTGTKGWNNYKEISAATVKTDYPELVGKVAAGSTFKYRLAVAGNELITYIDGYEIFREKIERQWLLDGQFAFVSSQTLMKIENVKISSLAELTSDGEPKPVEGITFPTVDTSEAITVPKNYISSTVVDVSVADAIADIAVAHTDTDTFAAFVSNSGKAGIARITDGARTDLYSSDVTLADPAAVKVGAKVVNGYVRLTVDGALVGSVYIGAAQSSYGVIASTGVTYKSGALGDTDKFLERMQVRSDMQPIEYGTKSPDWSGLHIEGVYSDGSITSVDVTDDMVSGYDPDESGLQKITVSYEFDGEKKTCDFTVTVKPNPVSVGLKVGVMSDVHVGANASNKTAIQNALKYYKAKGIDLLVVVGDIGHNKYDYLSEFETVYESVYASADDVPQKLYVMGNHDTYCIEEKGYARGTAEHNAEIEKVFTETFGLTADHGQVGVNYYKIVNGYVFVGLYIHTPIAERAEMIAKAASLPEAQGKPIFVVQHEQPIGSVYIANGTNSGAPHDFEIDEVLKQYPNAIMLAGHAHNPLADERAIWQGDYTVVTCGSLFGPIVEPNMYEGGTENGSFQPDLWSAKSALYMEVSDSSVNIVRYDFTHNEKLGKNWIVPIDENGSVDRTPYNYAARKAVAVAPEFAEDAVVTAEPLSESIVRITFPKAVTEYIYKDDIIQSYIIRAFNDETNELCGVKRICSQHYLGRDLDHDSYTLRFNGLRPDINYRFEVTAAESYQVEGRAITVKASTAEFSTAGRTADFYADFQLPWDKKSFDSFTHIASAPVTFATGAAIADGRSSSKIMLKDTEFSDGSVETRITMTASGGLINGGLFLFASDAANEQDTITALNVNMESQAGSRDLRIIIYRFTGKYDTFLSSITLTDYFDDGVQKESVLLKVEVTSGLISVFVDSALALTYDAGAQAKPGAVGFRSHYSNLSFDYLKIHITGGQYSAPDTAELDLALSNAEKLLSDYNAGAPSTVVCGQNYVPQSVKDALSTLVTVCKADTVKVYYRNVTEALAMLTEQTEKYENSIAVGQKHISSDWTVTKQATCTVTGERKGVCKECGKEVKETIEMLPHSYGSEQTHAPTCTQKGYTYHVCSDCEHEEKLSDIDAKGHTAGEWELDVKDGASSGERHKKCTVCDEVLQTESVYIIRPSENNGDAVPSNDGMSAGTIAATVIAVTEGVAILAYGVYSVIRKKRRKALSK